MNLRTHFIWLVFLALSCGEATAPAEKAAETPPKELTEKQENPQTEQAEEEETTSTSDPTTTAPVPAGEVAHGLVPCENQSPTPYIRKIAAQHTNVPYVMEDPTSRCSGIFQRFLGTLRQQCAQAEGSTPPSAVIDSRDQAKWYYNKQALTTITDPLKQAELIRPGAVMFYGKKDQDFYNNNPVEKLWNYDDGVGHVGIVVEVKRDAEGQIESYSLFHGQRPGKPSGITSAENYMHRRIAKENAPSFGNGSDPWVAVASLIVPES